MVLIEFENRLILGDYSYIQFIISSFISLQLYISKFETLLFCLVLSCHLYLFFLFFTIGGLDMVNIVISTVEVCTWYTP